MGFDHSERPQGSIYIIKKGYEKNVPDILAYGNCARSTTGSQKLVVPPKRHDNSLFLRS